MTKATTDRAARALERAVEAAREAREEVRKHPHWALPDPSSGGDALALADDALARLHRARGMLGN